MAVLVLEARSARAAFVATDLGRRRSGLSRCLRYELDSLLTRLEVALPLAEPLAPALETFLDIRRFLFAVGDLLPASGQLLLGLLQGDSESYLRVAPGWSPVLPSATDGDFTMADLIRLAGS